MTTENVQGTDLIAETVSASDLIEEANLVGCESVVTLKDWVAQNSNEEGVCVPCDFSTIAPWYRDILIKGGEDVLAERVDALSNDGGGTSHIAEVLDSVKAEVQNEAIKSHLTLYDCMLQTYKEETNGSEN